MATRRNRKEATPLPKWAQEAQPVAETVKETVPWHRQEKEVPWYQKVEAPIYDQNENASDAVLKNFMSSLLRSSEASAPSEKEVQAWLDSQQEARRYFSYVNTNSTTWFASARELGCSDRQASALVKALQNSLLAHR